MKLTVKRSVFLQELQTVQRAISSKTTIPILTGVKIVLSEDGLSLTGSNADISIESFLSKDDEKAQMTIERTGSIVLQSRFFGEIIRKLPEDMFTMEVLDNNQVAITSGKADFTVNGLDADNYPHLPVIDTQNQMKLPVHLLTKIISETGFAVSMHESRPILTGVHFVLSNHKDLKAVATDSHRMSQRQLVLEHSADNFDVVIPSRSLKELSAVFSDDIENLEVFFSANQILFRSETISFYTRLLEGNYPDTNRLLSDSFETEVVFETASLRSAMERSYLISNASQSGTVKLEIINGSVSAHVNSPEVGKVNEDIDVQDVSGSDLVISFNPTYLIDALKALKSETVRVRFISPVRPFTLTPADDSENFIQLITPVRTN